MIDSETAARKWLVESGYCNESALDKLERFAALLREENARQNLVSAASLDEVWRRHIVDSAQLLRLVSRETFATWLDLGSGAGFPGMVIATLLPDCAVTLVESRKRRVEWLESVREALTLAYVEVIGSRLELVQTRRFDVISARAFAPLPRLVDLSARFSTSTTDWLLPKGRSAKQELQDLRGWRSTFHVEQSLTDPEAGIIVGQLLGRKGT